MSIFLCTTTVKIIYLNRLIIFYTETQIILDIQIHFITNDHKLNSLPPTAQTQLSKIVEQYHRQY